MHVFPIAAYPTAKPAIPCSQSGVLKTRSGPNCSLSPTLHRNTPPKATSYNTGSRIKRDLLLKKKKLAFHTSPNTTALSSVSRAMRMASFKAVNKFIFFVSTPPEECRRAAVEIAPLAANLRDFSAMNDIL
jgi:hypothetical protein